MRKFYEHEGAPYAVEDVKVSDDKLQTKSGVDLKPEREFKFAEEPVTPRPPSRARLERRGQ
jgi:hypothetical protein